MAALHHGIAPGAIFDFRFSDGRIVTCMEITQIANGRVVFRSPRKSKGRWWLSIETVIECGKRRI